MPTKSDVIHETGCCLCGGGESAGPMGELCGTRANPGLKYHHVCRDAYGDNDGLDAELTRRKSAPSPLPEFRAKVGEVVSGDNHPSYGIHPGTHRGKLVHIRKEQGWANLELDDGQFRTVALDSIRPAPHPVESIPQAPSGGASGQSKADPYRNIATDVQVAFAMIGRDAWYRKRIPAVLADIDRPSVTHDKMGRPVARWTGWCSTRWAK